MKRFSQYVRMREEDLSSQSDDSTSPDQEKSMAKQMNASTTVLPASHVVMLSHPQEVAAVIEKATTLQK